MNAEFDGRDYAIGTVRGVRSFTADEYGRLRGVQYKDIWRPGENIAACNNKRPADGWKYSTIGFNGATYYEDGSGHTTTQPPMVQMYPEPHTLAECSHGYYAYYDGSNDYKTNARISAVVEGYGETLIGTRGFRAEKARIVAICIPDSENVASDENNPQWVRIRRWTPRIIWSIATGGQMGAAMLMWFNGSWINGIWSTLAAAAMFYITGWRARWIYKPEPDLIQKSRTYAVSVLTGEPLEINAATIAKIRKNYDGIPVFSSFADMVAAYPPDSGLTPSPENDPNFWNNK